MTSVALFCLHHWVMAQQAVQPVGGYRDWRVYGGSPDHIQYSVLDQINRGNVGRLTVAWQCDSEDGFPNSQMECTPIVIGGGLFATTPKLRVIALDAASGQGRWSFDPNAGQSAGGRIESVNRGLAYWASGPDQRIFLGAGHFLWALDATTGKPGKPVFPIEYRQVPASDVDGEKTARTQPFPLLPQPFAPQTFTEKSRASAENEFSSG